MFIFKVENILKIPLEILNQACQQIQVDQMTEDERNFLSEYHKILTPVVCALKTLSANQFSFGLYLPVLVGLNRKLNDAKNTRFIYGNPLAHAIEDGFQKRFFKYMDIFDLQGRSTPLYIAMAINPQFKLNYLGFEPVPAHTSNRVFDMLLNAGKEIVNEERARNRNRTDLAVDTITNPTNPTRSSSSASM